MQQQQLYKQILSTLLIIVVIISLKVECITTTISDVSTYHASTPRTKMYENTLPFQLIKIQELTQSTKFRNVKSFTNIKNSKDLTYPVWPLQFNATLLKITPFNTDIQWTKLYYDYKNQLSKFDFYDSYYGMNNEWGATNFTILWWNSTVWYIYPKTKECWIRSRTLPLVSPDWLKMTSYIGRSLFRGLYSDVWQFPNVDDLDGMKYYHRVADKMEDRIPLRSTNQLNDPGATDYVDFIIGQSDLNLYEIPKYCPK